MVWYSQYQSYTTGLNKECQLTPTNGTSTPSPLSPEIYMQNKTKNKIKENKIILFFPLFWLPVQKGCKFHTSTNNC
jgi:hypothetical protein